ncbi:hypothetical protein Tco_0558746 [Tanacetum coccineum]
MTITSPPPTLTLVERLYAVHNINTLVPEKLDLEEANYSSWCYFFRGHCTNFGVLPHLDGKPNDASVSTPPPPPNDEWLTADSIVKSWLFLTLSPALRKRLIKANWKRISHKKTKNQAKSNKKRTRDGKPYKVAIAAQAYAPCLLLPQSTSMAEIVSKEAQKKSKAGICSRFTSHN